MLKIDWQCIFQFREYSDVTYRTIFVAMKIGIAQAHLTRKSLLYVLLYCININTSDIHVSESYKKSHL